MKRLVLDAGPVITLFSRKDDYHELAKQGFACLPREFGEVILLLSIVFEAYKFVAFNESFKMAQEMLATIEAETVIEILSQNDFLEIFSLATQYPEWTGTLEDASVLVIAQRTQSSIWTIDYQDLGFFKNVNFWTP
jgi:predicted nucleic acid-binding protein